MEVAAQDLLAESVVFDQFLEESGAGVGRPHESAFSDFLTLRGNMPRKREIRVALLPPAVF